MLSWRAVWDLGGASGHRARSVDGSDGVTVEEDEFEAGGPDQVIAAIVGTREGAAEVAVS
jgi:hypothetical protein